MAMSLDTCSPSLTRSGLRPAAGLGLPVKCCADATLLRGEPIAASALHCRRFLLLEVPGPWGRSGLDESHLEPGVARALGAAADANDVRVVLIRRPGRHPGAGDQPGNLAWAIADTSPGSGDSTENSTSPEDLRRTRSMIAPPAGVYFTALSTRKFEFRLSKSPGWVATHAQNDVAAISPTYAVMGSYWRPSVTAP